MQVASTIQTLYSTGVVCIWKLHREELGKLTIVALAIATDRHRSQRHLGVVHSRHKVDEAWEEGEKEDLQHDKPMLASCACHRAPHHYPLKASKCRCILLTRDQGCRNIG